jgi:hypothetical protein
MPDLSTFSGDFVKGAAIGAGVIVALIVLAFVSGLILPKGRS